MQTANVMLALGGDLGNTIPKYGVTASEIAVLRAIHGDDAVFDIAPADDIERSHRDERDRLMGAYSRLVDGRDTSPVSVLFPGAAARMFVSIDELGIPEEFFKAETRVRAQPAEPAKRGRSKSAKADGVPDVEEMADASVMG